MFRGYDLATDSKHVADVAMLIWQPQELWSALAICIFSYKLMVLKMVDSEHNI